MDSQKLQDLFDDKYQKLLGQTWQQWQATAPQTENEAYQRLNTIDRELNATYDAWYEAQGAKKDKLEGYRDRLKAEYDLLEQAFGLEAPDKDW